MNYGISAKATLFAAAAGIAAALSVTPRAAQAQVANVGTGLDGSYNLIAAGGVVDTHWTSSVDSTFDPTGTTQTVYPGNNDWYGGWLANGPNSDWIARNSGATNNGPAPYTFSTTFSLAGYDPSTASISGLWAIDDQGTMTLNGNTVSTIGNGNWGALTAFSAGASDFVSGLNTLTITMTSDDQFLEAIRVEGSVSANRQISNATPEPGSAALLGGLFAAGAGFAIRRRRKA